TDHDLGRYEGRAAVVGDPRISGADRDDGGGEGIARVVLRIDGRRYESWVRGDLAAAVGEWRGCDRVHVRGERMLLDRERAVRVAWQHVVGRFRFDPPTGRDGNRRAAAPGSPVDRASNAVRAGVERGASVLPEPDDALFRGLVIGDRRGQPDDMVERFRSSGLSHLTVVSGLNVALLLAVAAPLLRRTRPVVRWVLTLLLVAWFASLTRFEPSIVRAAAMAAFSATAYLTGRERAPARLLGLAVVALLLVDPLLAHAAGFWLSVGATAGVCTIGPWLADRLPGPRALVAPFSITVGAQVGVAPPLIAVFGHLPLVSVPANLVAVPVASLVKLYGLPASLVAGWVPSLAAPLMLPCRFGVRWVDLVAGRAAALEPGGPWPWIGWSGLVAVIGVAVALHRR
ncbi:MAG: ComEC/Rec2 family competence protein, partial [Ilumatobacteraceae bacterium]